MKIWIPLAIGLAIGLPLQANMAIFSPTTSLLIFIPSMIYIWRAA